MIILIKKILSKNIFKFDWIKTKQLNYNNEKKIYCPNQ